MPQTVRGLQLLSTAGANLRGTIPASLGTALPDLQLVDLRNNPGVLSLSCRGNRCQRQPLCMLLPANVADVADACSGFCIEDRVLVKPLSILPKKHAVMPCSFVAKCLTVCVCQHLP